MAKNLIDEMFDRAMPEPNSGCWIWMGGLTEKGYATLKINGKSKRVHRVTYEAVKKPIPEGLVLDHLCRVRCCINPDHLEAVTNLVNIQRGHPSYKRSAKWSSIKSTTRPCPAGHFFSGLRCVECKREYQRAYNRVYWREKRRFLCK